MPWMCGVETTRFLMALRLMPRLQKLQTATEGELFALP